MTKRYGRWCVAIALLNSLAGPAAAWAGAADASSESGVAGREAAGAVMGQFGTADGLRQRTAEPLTAGGELRTFDGQKTGSAYLTNPSSTAFMTILAQPGGTGDLTTVQIGQDTNFSGTADYGYTLPMRVSGVCANGIISCNAGTWQNCTPYRWQADGAGRVSLQETVLGNLGGCYCINTSCGSGLAWNNMSLVLKDLGGGAVGAVQAVKSGYVVTQADIDGPTIAYFGQDTTSSAGGGGSGSVAQSQYYSNSAAITGDAETMAAAQAGDPDSTYAAVLTSFSNRGTDYDLRTCSITRVISVEGPQCPEGIYNAQLGWCEAPYWESMFGNGVSEAIAANYYEGRVTVNGFTVRLEFPQYGMDNTSMLPNLPAQWQQSQWYVRAEWNGSNTAIRVANFTTVDGGVVYGSWIPIGCPDGNPPTNGSCYVADPICPENESINDNCTTLAANPDCSLRHESVDGVVTYTNNSPTGLSPLPSQQTLGESVCIMGFTRNWWRKDQEYFCQTSSNFSFGDAGQRIHTITGSTLDNDPAPIIPYNDQRRDPDTGAWLAESGSVRLPDLPTVDDCQFVCKTRRQVEDTDVAYGGPASNLLSSNQSWEFHYRTCADNTDCPVLPGEEILTPCECINEFAEATTIMMTLDQAAKDLICSSGERR